MDYIYSETGKKKIKVERHSEKWGYKYYCGAVRYRKKLC